VPRVFLIGNAIVSCLLVAVVWDALRGLSATKSERKRPTHLAVPTSFSELSKTQKRKKYACDILLLGKEKETHFAHNRSGI
jgi:hypothetical protein